MRLFIYILSLLTFLIVSCANPKTHDSYAINHSPLHYSVRLSHLHPESLLVRLRISENSTGNDDFVLPFVYFDNPHPSFSGPLVNDLQLFDSSGQKLDTTSRSEMLGPKPATVFTIPSDAAYPVTVEYRLDFSVIEPLSGQFMLQAMHIHESGALMMGPYLFAVPYNRSLPAMWRTKRAIRVHLDFPQSAQLLGVPSNDLTYENIYELLFIQLALEASQVGSGTGGNQPFSLHLVNGIESAGNDWEKTAKQFATILDSITPLFGQLSDETYPVFFYHIGGGLEGTHSFFIGLPDDLGGYLPMVFAHEVYHHTVGIRCGEFDDPWWKEGTANYLGYVTAGRCGYASNSFIYDALIRGYSSSPHMDNYPPSSEAFRSLIFTDTLHHIAYGKGGQISMLLDYVIRQRTDNRQNLATVTADLVHKYSHSAFTRRQMVMHFAQNAGVSIEPILKKYADTAGKIPLETLNEVFRRLAHMNAFGSDTTTDFMYMAKQRSIGQDHTPELFFHY